MAVLYDPACNFWCPSGKYSWFPSVPNPSCVSTSSVLLYAGDMKIYNSIKSSSDAASLQDDLSSPSKWSKTWCHSFSNKTCQLMRFNIKSPLYFKYLIEDTVTTNKSSIKNLGVLLSPDLTWNLHVLDIIGKPYRSLGLLRHTFSDCNSVSAKKKTLPHPHQIKCMHLLSGAIMYASPIWRHNICISYLAP